MTESTRIQSADLDPNCGFATESTAQEILSKVANGNDGKQILLAGGTCVTFNQEVIAVEVNGGGYLHWAGIYNECADLGTMFKVELDGVPILWIDILNNDSAMCLSVGLGYLTHVACVSNGTYSNRITLTNPEGYFEVLQNWCCNSNDTYNIPLSSEKITMEQLQGIDDCWDSFTQITAPLRFENSLKVSYLITDGYDSSTFHAVSVGYTLDE